MVLVDLVLIVLVLVVLVLLLVIVLELVALVALAASVRWQRSRWWSGGQALLLLLRGGQTR